jgi:phage-related protein
LKTVWKLFENCLKTVRKLFENCSKTVRKLFKNCSKTVENCSKTVRKLFVKFVSAVIHFLQRHTRTMHLNLWSTMNFFISMAKSANERLNCKNT